MLNLILAIYLPPISASAQEILDLGRSAEDMRVSNYIAFAGLGRSLSTGDVNGDGIDDAIGGAEHIPRFYLGGGGAFLVFGSTQLPRLIDLENPDRRVAFWGTGGQDLAGDFVDIFDFSGDGVGDVFIYAPQWVGPEATHQGEGEIYYFQGRPTWPSDIMLEDYPTDNLAATLHGVGPKTHLGLNHSAHGDFDGDGVHDLATSSRSDGTSPSIEQASVHVLWGGQPLVTGRINSAEMRHTTIVVPSVTGVAIGVFSGNLDQDAFDDVIVAVYGYSSEGETVDTGYILWGRQTWPESINLAEWQQYPDITRMVTDRRGTYLGATIAVGDFNGNSEPDLALMWKIAGLKPGFVYIYPDVFINNRPRVFNGFDEKYGPTVILDRHLAHYNFPYRISSLDWNDDGYDDLAISNSHARRDAGRASEGIVYVVYGGTSLPDSIDLQKNNAKWDMIWGGSEHVNLGQSIAKGDLDDDSRDDLLLGGWTATTKAGLASGEFYVLLNRSRHTNQTPPERFAILPISPNPTNGQAVIPYDLLRSEQFQLAIFDILGKRVRLLRDGISGPGRYSAVWDGRNELNISSPSGVYFAVLHAGGRVHARKVLLIR